MLRQSHKQTTFFHKTTEIHLVHKQKQKILRNNTDIYYVKKDVT